MTKKSVRKPAPKPRPKPPIPAELQDLFDNKPVKPQPKPKAVYNPPKKRKEAQHSDLYIFVSIMVSAAVILIAAGLLSDVIGILLNGG